ncbi:MAG: hypothetical protein HFJ06_13905 [Lachnospiraceae bacterium]|nr:hypothetical protein [Lachnospiraceae bacterium]
MKKRIFITAFFCLVVCLAGCSTGKASENVADIEVSQKKVSNIIPE